MSTAYEKEQISIKKKLETTNETIFLKDLYKIPNVLSLERYDSNFMKAMPALYIYRAIATFQDGSMLKCYATAEEIDQYLEKHPIVKGSTHLTF
jgi:hypothetical protein